MFDRMANGDVAPVRKIGGPMTGALGAFRQLKVDSERGMVYLAVQSFRRASADAAEGGRPLYERGVAQEAAGERGAPGRSGGTRDPFTSAGFIGAWSLDDDGNVPPRLIIRGPSVGATGFAGVAFSAKHGELYGVSGRAERVCRVDRPGVLPEARDTDAAGGAGRNAQWAMGNGNGM